LRCVGPVVALALFSRIDLDEITASLAAVRWPPLVLSLMLAAPLLVAKAWRWRRLLHACGQRISLLEAIWLYAISAGAGALTPGAVGDFWKGLSPAIGRRSVGLWTSALDRFHDVAILLLLGVGIATARSPSGETRILLLLAIGGILLGAFAARRRLLDLVASRLPRFSWVVAAPWQTGSLPAAAAATVVATIVAFGRFELLVVALSLPLGWSQAFVAFVLSSGVAALPLSVAGVGTRDLALVVYLRACGISSAHAIALSSLCLLLLLWNGVLASVLWVVRPPPGSNRSSARDGRAGAREERR
jgi:uncharacterized membrane protein YbhN (UPF0104 family)